MKKQLMLFIAITSLAWTACKKNDSNPIPDNQNLLTRITEMDANDTTLTTVSYDNNKRISTVKTSDGSESNFTYNGNNLVTIENKADAENKTILQVTYENEKPSTAVYAIYEDGELHNKYKVSYILTGNAVSQILMKDSTNTTEVAKTVITYQNNNIAKVESYYDGHLSNTQNYTYGNKRSIFSSTSLKYVIDPFTLQLFSDNEVTKETSTFGDSSQETTHAYTYDENGFPLTAVVSEKELPAGETTTSTLKFEY